MRPSIAVPPRKGNAPVKSSCSGAGDYPAQRHAGRGRTLRNAAPTGWLFSFSCFLFISFEHFLPRTSWDLAEGHKQAHTRSQDSSTTCRTTCSLARANAVAPAVALTVRHSISPFLEHYFHLLAQSSAGRR